jgi:hypothetical protein
MTDHERRTIILMKATGLLSRGEAENLTEMFNRYSTQGMEDILAGLRAVTTDIHETRKGEKS